MAASADDIWLRPPIMPPKMSCQTIPQTDASTAVLDPFFAQPTLAIFAEVDAKGGLAVDLGCGNGWYLRKLAARWDRLRGIGLDGFAANVDQARALADAEGLGDRLEFREGDLHHFTVDEPASLIAMNRALHHVSDPSTLRSHPRLRGMAFQNLAEHVQGNHFLQPEEIAAELTKAGLEPTVYRFVEGTEAVVVGRKP